ncbi:LysR family transcriptional regulator [Maribius pontilimi]|uniref:LysR family transcriptional regulator n=1 Tax=Palleronia pontilimi TaxID=1964209 RepID=A0A934IIA2_9RHOB|nr:LysR family transcriptional regulator [Palleronia pontilimi]MBJ3763423.1 LysR family transcriptional regulator [Palleronia pontilimi]
MTKIAWDEIRTAFHVAQIGTVSGAASELGVHHATVIRHIDALEATLGVKLFQRHPRGYTATEAGLDVLQVAQATEDQFAQLVSRVKGQGDTVGGELIVTSLASISEFLTPALVAFQQEHPDVIVRSLTGERLYRLEYGEAHVAIRAGARPSEPDNVAQKFGTEAYALYASDDYAARHGLPASDEDLKDHRFVSHDSESMQAPFYRWLNKTVPPESRRFRINDNRVARDAILAGAGLGFLPVFEAGKIPGIVQALPPRREWSAPMWIVTHVDLHRTTKVQTFLKFLKKRAADWPGVDDSDV